MVEKKRESATFETIVVLAIVAIVAVTGQVLIYYEREASPSYVSSSLPATGGNSISGFVVSEEASEPAGTNDLSVERIEVNPSSPLIGDPFEVKVLLKNKGDSQIRTPFIVEAYFEPREHDESLEPIAARTMMPKTLAPGEEAYATFLITTIMPEGPLRITATADATAKLPDDNPANNILSKTIVVTVE